MASIVDVRVVTFIPDAWLLFADYGYKAVYYKGDNRGFTPYTANTANFRSAHHARVDFSKRTLTVWRSVGETTERTVYSDGTVSYRYGQEVASCLTHGSIVWGSNYVTFKLYADCDNPLTLSPNINYALTVTVWNTGQVRIYGDHDGFPAYEFYKAVDYSTTWKTIYQFNPYANNQSVLSLGWPMEWSMDKTAY